MQATALRQYGSSPRYERFDDPVAHDGEVLVNVRAASHKPIVQSIASGARYASFRELPVVCGVDGAGLKRTVQIAEILGTGRVIAGRNPKAPESTQLLGADTTIQMEQPQKNLVKAFASSGLEIDGNGGGSVPRQAIAQVVPEVFKCAARGRFETGHEEVPFADVESAWHQKEVRRAVFVP
jgi:hypothetical protein